MHMCDADGHDLGGVQPLPDIAEFPALQTIQSSVQGQRRLLQAGACTIGEIRAAARAEAISDGCLDCLSECKDRPTEQHQSCGMACVHTPEVVDEAVAGNSSWISNDQNTSQRFNDENSSQTIAGIFLKSFGGMPTANAEGKLGCNIKNVSGEPRRQVSSD